MLDDDKLLENVRPAAGCGAGPTMPPTVALASTGAKTIDQALDRPNRLRNDIIRLDVGTPRPHAALAELEVWRRTRGAAQPARYRQRRRLNDLTARSRSARG
ncbi:MAG: hypothetical protein KJ015_39605 [Myxococcales bacterium]|nr:hypothetical protein [Myxococcales bacterium]MCL4756323.1 hypothetical protein [Myxococcales bacterium]